MRKAICMTIGGAIAILFAAQVSVAAGDGGDQASAKPSPAAEHSAKAPAAKSKSVKKYGATIGGKDIGSEHIEFDADDEDDQDDPGHLQLGNPSVAPGAGADSYKP